MKFPGYPTIFIVICFIAFACNSEKKVQEENQQQTFICNADSVDVTKNEFPEANQKELYFSGGFAQTNEYAHSGNYSIKLFPGRPFGFTATLKGIRGDDYIRVTVWRKNRNDNGVIVIDGGPGNYIAGKEIVEEDRNGWEKIYLEFFVPPTFTHDSAKIYTWINSPDTIYFDDFEIMHSNNKTYPDYKNLAAMQIHVDTSDIHRFEDKRLTAFQTGILMNSDDDYAPSILFDGNDFLRGELRLKGDLVDHLLGRKWSFRIKLKDDYTWNNLRTFSVQNPVTRYFLNEWLAHKIFDQEGILTTRYGFVPLELNEKSLGIYAWEEHFEKQLVESRKRREGPIIRFNEDVFWKRNQEITITGKNWDIDYFSAAQIIPFKENSIVSDSLMRFQFEEAETLLNQYKNREAPVSEIFDVDKLARYYALLDLTQAYHGFTWHNQRFYYNPVTCLLECIAFDGYIDNGIYRRFDEPVSGLVNPAKMTTLLKEELMLYQVFCDSAFNTHYIEYLTKFSSPEFLSSIVSNYKTEADSLAGIIRAEYPYYRFSFDFIRQQAELIRQNLPAIAANVYKIGEAVSKIPNEKFRHEYTTEINPDLVHYQVHAYYDRAKKQLSVQNFTNTTITVVGVILKDKLPVNFDSGNVLSPFNGYDKSEINFTLEDSPEILLFSVGTETFETTVSNWKEPGEKSQRQKIEKTNLPEKIQVIGGKVVLDGNYTFDSDVFIPQNLTLFVKPGTKIDLINNAGFFCSSTVTMEGTIEKPIEISSSDKSANGFNILQVENRSTLKYVHFSGLGSIRKKGWQTPAAVTFYESDADIDNCIFANNSNCDDALNMVRSDFLVRNCRFENTFADAFDSDFCTGKVLDCTFENIGNDAIDFSGSVVDIIGCTMLEISDKAVSGGENSTLYVENCNIDNANIGVASKDLSLVKLNKITMKNIVYGLVAFQKKPEYGPAKIEIENIRMRNKIAFQKIEIGSTLKLNGKLMQGRERKLAVKLYQ